jgi:hypothetical protein
VTSILVLDAGGTPSRWIDPEKAVYYINKGRVAWSLGNEPIVMRGGINAATGMQSVLELPPIMAIKGSTFHSRNFRTPAVDREALFRRDRHLCAYCGQVFKDRDLTADHVMPESRGGAWSWMNLVSACRICNGRKDDRTPEEARMALLYLPYVPSRHEHFLLSGRKVLADQVEFLMLGVPAHSRLHS